DAERPSKDLVRAAGLLRRQREDDGQQRPGEERDPHARGAETRERQAGEREHHPPSVRAASARRGASSAASETARGATSVTSARAVATARVTACASRAGSRPYTATDAAPAPA